MPNLEDGKINFEADSNTAITKGLVSIFGKSFIRKNSTGNR